MESPFLEMPIIRHTNLARIIDKDIRNESYAPTIWGRYAYSEEELNGWIQDDSSANNSITSRHATTLFNKFKRYIQDPDTIEETLIHYEHLRSSGMPVSMLDPIIRSMKAQRHKKNECIFMAIYYNTIGVSRSIDAIRALSMFYDEHLSGTSGTGRRSTTAPFSANDAIPVVTLNSGEMTIERVKGLVKSIYTNHTQDSMTHTSVGEEMGEVNQRLLDQLTCCRLNEETLLHEMYSSCILPKQMELLFESVVEKQKCLDLDQMSEHEQTARLGISLSVYDIFERMRYRMFDMSKHLISLRRHLYTLVMPNTFTIPNSDSTAMMNIIVHHILGCSASSIRSFHEVVNFKLFSEMKRSDLILKLIDDIERDLRDNPLKPSTPNVSEKRTIEQDDTGDVYETLTRAFMYEMTKQMCFVIWFHMLKDGKEDIVAFLLTSKSHTRLSGMIHKSVSKKSYEAKINTLHLGRIDAIEDNNHEKGVTVDRAKKCITRDLAPNTIYYFKGRYYLATKRQSNNLGILRSKYYRRLIAFYLLSL